MNFEVIPACFQDASNHRSNRDIDFLIEEDDWNDFGFHTLYHVHAARKLTKGSPEYLGSISIMRYGQTTAQNRLIRNIVGKSFQLLPDDFCSLSMSVELYRGLDRYLGTRGSKKDFVKALRMIFSPNERRYKRFHRQECFNTSLLRNADMNAYPLEVGREIMLSETSNYDLAKVPLKYTLPKSNESVDFDFGTIDPDLAKTLDIPSRILACIGNNGVGKSTILYRLARILFASPLSRDNYKDELGFITPNDAGFRRLFVVSYSAFDNFQLPGTSLDNYMLILEGLRNRNGRFVFCGIRDIETEYQEEIERIKYNKRKGVKDEVTKPHPGSAQIVDGDHSPIHRLKTIENLAEEFQQSYLSIEGDREKREMWNRLMEECLRANESFEIFIIGELLFCDENEIQQHFIKLSTGIKYVLHSIACILDRIEYNSIIIFDEPENHIQPPLLSKFLYCLRILADKFSSLVLVATHSPVILQETLAKNVLVVSRVGDRMKFRRPSIETFGENIGNITNEVFNLNTSVTNYQNTAKKIIEEFSPHYRYKTNPLAYLKYIKTTSGLNFGKEIEAYIISQLLSSRN